MKAVYILLILAFISCRRKHNCVCTDANGTATSIGSVSGTKKQAKRACEQVIAGNSTSSCKLN